MADRFPLILNTSNNQIQEIASGDNLDLTGTGISNAGIITAGNVTIGAATTDLVVNGDARITGILTIGTSSLKLDGPNNLVNVGTALTLGHTQGLQFHTQNLHSAGFEVNQINVSGASTMGDDVTFTGDSYNVLWDKSQNQLEFSDNAKASFGTDNDTSIVHSGTNTIMNVNGNYFFQGNTFYVQNQAGTKNYIRVYPTTTGAVELYHDNTKRFETTTSGVTVTGDGTFTGNVSIGGTLTYEDVTNIDSVGIITAREGIFIPDNKVLHLGNVSGTGDLQIYHDTSDSYVKDVGTGDLVLQTQGGHVRIKYGSDTMALFQASGYSQLYFNNNVKLATTSAGGTLTGTWLPAADATGNFGSTSKRWGTVYATSFAGDGSNLTGIDTDLVSDTSPQLGGDLDTNGNNIIFDDNDQLRLGNATGGDIVIKHTTSDNNGHIENHTGDLLISTKGAGDDVIIEAVDDIELKPQGGESGIKVIGNGAVELYHNDTKKFETRTDGCALANITNNNGLDLNGVSNNTCIRFMSTGSSPGHAYRINYHSVTNNIFNSPCISFDKTATNGNFDSHIGAISDNGFHLADNKKLHLGGTSANGDLKIYHDGTYNRIESGATTLMVRSNLIEFGDNSGNKYIKCIDGGATELYHNSNKRFETTANGIKVVDNGGYFDINGGYYFRGTGTSWNMRVTTTNTGSTSIFQVQDHASANVLNVVQDSYVHIANPLNFYIGNSDTNYTSSDGIRFMQFGGTTARWFTNTFNNPTGGNTPGPYLYNRNGSHSGVRFYVKVDGGVVNHSGNNSNLCDERMKTNIVDAPSYWNSIKNIGIKKFNYKTEPEGTPLKVGVIAQQVETIESDLVDDDFAVDGNPNEEGATMMKSVHEEQLFMMAVKALQEAQARIETLEAEVAALKGS